MSGTGPPAHAAGRCDEALWRRLAPLRPRLRSDVGVIAQRFRGERWYLLHDETSGGFLRLDAAAKTLLDAMDGELTVAEILERANASSATAADEAGDVDAEALAELLARLHEAEVLSGSLPLEARDALERYRQLRRRRRRQRWANPLAMRIPLLDPDRLLERLAPFARVAFTRAGFAFWLAAVTLAVPVAIAHRGELAAALGALRLDAPGVLAFGLAYPLLKALHELGHGLAVKLWGGEVHECGISLLLFVPVPYVDASAAWGFQDKRRRVLVGAAGILVETLFAALGLLLWALVEPGAVRDAALTVAILGGLSTVLCNGNPLLRFDGYHVLEDLVEIPNLATRARRYPLYLVQRHLLGLADARSPVTARGERRWLLGYGLLAPLYRIAVLIGIAAWLAESFLLVGVALASWVVFAWIVRPVLAASRFLLVDERLRGRRVRALALGGSVGAAALGALAAPLPLVTRAEGVVWSSERGRIVAAVDGFVAETPVAPGERVEAGEPLIRLRDGALETRRRALVARLEAARVRETVAGQKSRVDGAMAADETAVITAELARLDERRAALLIESPIDGRFERQGAHDPRGRFVRAGDVLGHVLDEGDAPLVHAVVEQRDAARLDTAPARAEIVLAARPATVLPARLLREVPSGTRTLPSAALGSTGGGSIDLDPTDPSGRTAAEEVFELEFALPEGSAVAGIGERAYVRLEHGDEALWKRGARSVRRLFLGAF